MTYRIGGRQRAGFARIRGAAVGIPPLVHLGSNRNTSAVYGTVSAGQFDWGGRLPKSNGGAQRYPQRGWKPRIERKGIRVSDCETYRSSRDESRA